MNKLTTVVLHKVETRGTIYNTLMPFGLEEKGIGKRE